MKSVKCTNLFFLQLLLISTRISNYFQHCSSRMNRLHENNSEILIPVLVRLTLKQRLRNFRLFSTRCFVRHKTQKHEILIGKSRNSFIY